MTCGQQVIPLHGTNGQAQNDENFDTFMMSALAILLGTDIAYRGFHFQEYALSLISSYRMSTDVEMANVTTSVPPAAIPLGAMWQPQQEEQGHWVNEFAALRIEQGSRESTPNSAIRDTFGSGSSQELAIRA
jgi:hypothetical protein